MQFQSNPDCRNARIVFVHREEVAEAIKQSNDKVLVVLRIKGKKVDHVKIMTRQAVLELDKSASWDIVSIHEIGEELVIEPKKLVYKKP